jgi:excisionase family DNA binding protein
MRPASSTEPCSQSVSSPVRDPPIPRSAQNLELDGSPVNGSPRAFLPCFEDLRDRVIGSHLDTPLKGLGFIVSTVSTLDPLLSVEDLAVYLDVPVATIYAWRYRRQGPPGFKVGRHLRYRQSDVNRWIGERVRDGAPWHQQAHR